MTVAITNNSFIATSHPIFASPPHQLMVATFASVRYLRAVHTIISGYGSKSAACLL